MCSELLYLVFAVLVLFLIDSYSTSLAVVLCGSFIYFYIQIFSKGSNKDRYIVSLIIKAWGGFSYILLLWKHLILLFKNIITYKKSSKVPNQSSCQHCGETASLEKEIDVIVFNISQYYLYSWYKQVGDNEEFITHLNSIIKDTLLSLCSKVTTVNRERISYAILQIYLHFFVHFMEAKKKSIFILDDFEMKHWASQDSMTEWCYLQSLVSSLIDTFGPVSPQKSLHSKQSPILHNFIVEILTEHILHPLSNLLSDPSQLNSWLLKVLETYIDVENLDSFLNNENLPVNVPCEVYNSGPKILLEDEDSFPSDAESKLKVPHMLCDKSGSELSDYEKNKTLIKLHNKKNADCLSPFMSSSIKSSSNINLLDSDLLSARGSKSEACSPVSCDTSTIKRSKSADYIRQMPQLRALNMRDYNIVMQGENNKMFVALKSDSNTGGFIEEAEEAFEVPTLFSDVRISDTMQQSEAGLLPYTLYCIQYSGVFHDTGKSSEKPHFIKQEISIKRRFREFLALQSRLEDNPSLKNYLKGIKGPSKWLALPFSNMDKKNIAERKSFLENYLKELCNQGPIAQSSELQEFLAYGGDATVAFVKKAADINVPRIDKIFVRGVKGAIDMFKTALPYSAVEGGCSPEGSSSTIKQYSEDLMHDHRFHEHLLEFASREPEIRGHLRNYFKSVSSIPHFEQSLKNSEDYPQRASMLRYLYKLKAEKSCKCSGIWNVQDENFRLEENAFGNTVSDLIIESMKSSQFSSFHLFSVLKLLLSPSIERHAVSLFDQFSERHLAIFLHILHNALWPSESDSVDESNLKCRPDNTHNYNRLKQYLKVVIATSNGTMNVSCIQKFVLERIYLFLSSIQYQQLNSFYSVVRTSLDLASYHLWYKTKFCTSLLILYFLFRSSTSLVFVVPYI